MLYEYNKAADAGHKMKVFGLLGDKDAYKSGHRDDIMASSLQSFMSDSAAMNGVYCSVGIAHALGAAYSFGDFTVPTFVSLLSGNGIAAKSMVLVPINSACYLPKNDEMISPPSESTKMASSDGPLTYSLNIINLKKASKGVPMAIYDLSVPGSPFNSGTDFVGFRSPVPFMTHPYRATPGHSTTDYFQYILMIQDQPSPAPLPLP